MEPPSVEALAEDASFFRRAELAETEDSASAAKERRTKAPSLSSSEPQQPDEKSSSFFAPSVRLPPPTKQKAPVGILKTSKFAEVEEVPSKPKASKKKKSFRRSPVAQTPLLASALIALSILLLFGGRVLQLLAVRQSGGSERWVETPEEIKTVFESLEGDESSGGLAFELKRLGLREAPLLRELKPFLEEKLRGKDASLARFIVTSSAAADQVHRATFSFCRVLNEVEELIQKTAVQRGEFAIPEEMRQSVASSLEEVVRAAVRFQLRVREALQVSDEPEGLTESAEANAVWQRLLELSELGTGLALARLVEELERWGVSESPAAQEAKRAVEETLVDWPAPPEFEGVEQEIQYQLDRHGMPAFMVLTLSPLGRLFSTMPRLGGSSSSAENWRVKKGSGSQS